MTEQFESPANEAPSIGFAKGNPDDVEAGAVMAVLMAAMADRVPAEKIDDRPLAGGWKSYYRTVRRPVAPGREAWRNTYRLG